MLNINPFEGEEHRAFYWEAENTAGAALLVHGFPGTPAEMRAVGQALHQAGWSAQGLLLPGFGAEFPALRQHKAVDWLRAVDTALAALQDKYQRTLLVGYSMGGGLALQAAARRPPDGLVLLAPFSRASGAFWAALPVFKLVFPTIKPFRIFKPDLSRPETRAGMANFLPDVDLDDPQVRRALGDFEFPLATLDELRKVGRGAYAAAPQVTASTLVIQGREDAWVRPQATRRLLQAFSTRVQYMEVDAAHDLVDMDKPAWPAIRGAILDFCAEIGLTRSGV